ncbi:Uncharacterised protein [Mycobacteroides abscessus subsp. abscessus]|nr:Uncharacterised protein [Mycobacteroides abscessus subsp. abscessus]
MARDKGKTLQARVDAEYAQRFAVLAAAKGISESALVRQATDKILAEAEGQIDALKAEVRARLRADEEKSLAELDSLADFVSRNVSAEEHQRTGGV